MANLPIINNLRVVPRDAEFLDRKTGARGEIFYDKDNNTIRLYDSNVVGGLPLARGDLTNVTNAIFAAKATAAGVGGGSGSGSIEVSQTAPSTPTEGTIWFNSSNGTLYVYINDGDSNQWVQPVLGYPAIPDNLQDLTNVTITTPSADQVLKWNGAAWINAAAPAAGLDQSAVRSSISVGTEGTAAGDGAVSYDNTTGVFTYAPPLLNSLTVSGTLDMGSNDITTTGKVYFANVFATEGDLPSATTYHGMFAHVHATGAGYFAHAGAWVKLANNATTLAGYGITDGQATLVSGTNIKTVNGTSLIGSGDIAVAGNTGNITFNSNTIDSTDSTSIVFTPAVDMDSDVTVGNDLTILQDAIVGVNLTVNNNAVVNNDLTVQNNLIINGEFTSEGSGTPEIFSDNEIELNAGTRIVPTTGPLQMLRVTTTQRNALTAANGDLIYNTTDNKFQGYENGSWVNLI